MKHFFLRFLIAILISAHSITYASFLEIDLFIKDHKFYPDVIKIPAGQKVKITVHNQDSSVEEFESVSLKKEKFIPGKSSIKIVLPGLKPGIYDFFGDFHQDTAKGFLQVE